MRHVVRYGKLGYAGLATAVVSGHAGNHGPAIGRVASTIWISETGHADANDEENHQQNGG